MHNRICPVCSKEFSVRSARDKTKTCGSACGHALITFTPERRLEVMWSKIDRSGPCWLWQGGTNGRGYGAIAFCGKVLAVHRLMYQLAHGNIDPKVFVLHGCDTPRCCNPAHLYLGDNDRNMQDRTERGRNAISRAKLTPEQVDEIRAKYRVYGHRKSNGSDLAREYGVNPGTIYAIAKGRSWTSKGTLATVEKMRAPTSTNAEAR